VLTGRDDAADEVDEETGERRAEDAAVTMSRL
jgi:hypothetical protein